MKSRNITTIIAEGTDGVGKSELIMQLFKIYNYRYMVYHRGELSNLFYAQKYHRPFCATQVGLPFLHVLLTCDKEVLKQRIMKRDYDDERELEEELKKVDDQDEFIRLFNVMKKDYHMIMVDTTHLSIEEVGKKVAKMIDNYVAHLETDVEISEWNSMYAISCNKLGLNFTVRDNQPYINDIPFMAESTLHNGVYETFSDKSYPDNFIYSLAYGNDNYRCADKTLDFAYVIFSKVKRRPEVYEYLAKFMSNDKTCLVANNEYMPINPLLERMPRMFGNAFITQLSRAKATVYCGRDLAYLKLQTARLYEAILAQQIVFVDKLSDPDCEMLTLMHAKDKKLIDLLYVTPETICEKYDYIMSHKDIYDKIINNQNSYYKLLKKAIKGGLFNA